jgi:hypothetical protein
MEMNIRGNWDRLTPSTQQWLTNNPGCMVLPRTIAAIISKETGRSPDRDRHGGTPLSQEDRDFIADSPQRTAARSGAADLRAHVDITDLGGRPVTCARGGGRPDRSRAAEKCTGPAGSRVDNRSSPPSPRTGVAAGPVRLPRGRHAPGR